MANLLYIPNHDGLGGQTGAPQSAYDFLIGLLATKHRVTVMCDNARRTPQFAAGVELGQPRWRPYPQNFPSFPTAMSLESASDLVHWLRTRKAARLQRQAVQACDAIFLNSMGSHVHGWRKIAPLATAWHKKSVIIVRESPGHFPGTVEVWRRNLDVHPCAVFVSWRGREEWIEVGSLANTQTFYVPNCCREDKVDELRRLPRNLVRKELSISTDAFVVACVASLQHRKGQDLILRHFAKLREMCPNIFLAFIGPVLSAKEAEGESIRGQIELREAMGESMHYYGCRVDALKFIYASDVLLLPARAEAMPRTVLEAMALETAVVASDVGGISEEIEHGATGLLFSIDHSEEMCELLAGLRSDPTRRQQIALAARQRYWARFARQHQVRRISEVVEHVLAMDV